jgi:hypothetical protein
MRELFSNCPITRTVLNGDEPGVVRSAREALVGLLATREQFLRLTGTPARRPGEQLSGMLELECLGEQLEGAERDAGGLGLPALNAGNRRLGDAGAPRELGLAEFRPQAVVPEPHHERGHASTVSTGG